MSDDRREPHSAEIPAEWMSRSNAYGWRVVAANALPYFLLLAIAPLLMRRRAFAPLLLSPLLGLFAYRLTIVMHDCIHRTLFADGAVNQAVGKTLGAISGIDFSRFSSQHLQHHRRVGEADDPQGFHYLDLGSLSAGARLWHLLKPLLGCNAKYAWPEGIFNPQNFLRAIQSGDAWLLLGAQACVAALVTGGGRHLTLALLPAVSSATVGLFLSQLRGIAEHAVIEGDPRGHVRTHAPHWLDRSLLYGLNFNYHEEHHRYPRVPSQYLANVHRALHQGEPERNPSMLATLAAVLMTQRQI